MKQANTTTVDSMPKGLLYVRIVGLVTGLGLIVWGFLRLFVSSWEPSVSGLQVGSVIVLIYGALLVLPWSKINGPRQWRILFGALVLISVAFVFLQVIEVMFAYMAVAEQGEKLSPPGLQGLLIFVALLQIPAIFFIHRPDLLN